MAELEKKTLEPDFWEQDENIKILEEISFLKEKEKLVIEFFELLQSGNFDEAKKSLKKLVFAYCFTSEKYQKNPAIVNIYSGAGGKDAEDWVSILVRMYQKFFEEQKFSYKIIDSEANETGGYKFFCFEVEKPHSYGILRFEKGVHRLVRISPFSAAKLRHTSFALVDVIPVINKPDFRIQENDLAIQTFRSGGAGGQNVNKVETAVRIIYKPLNLSVVCQSERAQHQNKDKAMQILYSKIARMMEERKIKEIQELKGEKISISWGNQKRSYIFAPYQLIKDHQLNYETKKINEVLDGHLELVHPLGAIL